MPSHVRGRLFEAASTGRPQPGMVSGGPLFHRGAAASGSAVRRQARHISEPPAGQWHDAVRARDGAVDAPQHEHQPVLVEPVLRLLAPRAGQVILDGTVGLGGHACALLPRILPGGRYIGLDLDEVMLGEARVRLGTAPPGSVELVQANFAALPEVLARLGFEQVDHILLDLGVNLHKSTLGSGKF